MHLTNVYIFFVLFKIGVFQMNIMITFITGSLPCTRCILLFFFFFPHSPPLPQLSSSPYLQGEQGRGRKEGTRKKEDKCVYLTNIKIDNFFLIPRRVPLHSIQKQQACSQAITDLLSLKINLAYFKSSHSCKYSLSCLVSISAYVMALRFTQVVSNNNSLSYYYFIV